MSTIKHIGLQSHLCAKYFGVVVIKKKALYTLSVKLSDFTATS